MIDQVIHLENIFDRELRCFKNRPQNIWEFIQNSIKINLNKTCIIDENIHYTYAHILKLVYSTDSSFLKYKFKKNDRIGILFENDINFIIVSLYCIKSYLPKNKNGKIMKKDLSKLYNLF